MKQAATLAAAHEGDQRMTSRAARFVVIASILALGLVGTVLIQAAWSTRFMGPTRFVVGILFLGAFAMLFALLAPASAEGESKTGQRGRWLAVRVGALLFPFAFAAPSCTTSRTSPLPHVHFQ